MSNIKQQKSILAKLLATENISVEHRKSITAYFDPKARVMVLPIWKEMSGNLYDLLLGHETGHALYTPAAGWHDAVLDKTKKGFKTYLNVVEDIRIEKMIQARYPGLKASFTKGYTELMEKDFFGTKEYDIQSLPLIDRINLHYKVGSFLNLQFTEKEKELINRLDKMKTWDDVKAMSTELYEHRKTEASHALQNLMKDFEYEFDEDEDNDDFDFDGDWEEIEEDSEDDTGKRKRNLRGHSFKDREDLEDEMYDPSSITDRAFRNNEKKLLDDSVKPYFYANCPKPNLKNIIVPFKKLKQYHVKFKTADYLTDNGTYLTKIENAKNKVYRDFLDINNKYISYLIKEFEMRRNARQFARASVSKTGELDVKKAFSYKINEDLFKRMTVVPNGKSHGLVMFIDYSGSMQDNIAATIEQTLILAMFCRKVNIPFRVYAFTDHHTSVGETSDLFGYNRATYEEYLTASYQSGSRGSLLLKEFAKFSTEPGEIDFSRSTGFKLKEYLSSEMTGVEFRNAAKYWLLVGRLFARNSWRYNRNRTYDTYLEGLNNGNQESMNGTPLNEAIVASMEIVKVFKEKYRLDVVNTVFLTDGDSNESQEKITEGRSSERIVPYSNDHRNVNIVVRDIESGTEGIAKPGTPITIALLKLLKAKLHCNVIGFFLTEDSSGKRSIHNKALSHGVELDIDSATKEYRKNKFFMLNDIGYDDYYIIPGGDELSIGKDEMTVSADASKNEVKKAFLKMQKSKNVNRVLLNRFVSKIS